MKTSTARKIIALLLSAVLLVSCVPMIVFADGEFVSENLLQTALDTENSHGICYNHNNKTVTTSTNGGLAANGVVAGLVDGITDTNHDIWGTSTTYAWDTDGCQNWYGVQYKLTSLSFASRVDVYADYEGLECYYDIYASDRESDLYCGLNYMGKIYCDGKVKSVKINKNVLYVAIVFDAISSGNTNARPKEIQLWSGDEENTFEPIDLTDASLGKYTTYNAVTLNTSTLAASAWNIGASTNNPEVSKLNYITSNVTGSHEDFNPNSSYGAFQFTFDNMYYIGDVVIDSEIWTYDQDWAIYASNISSNLYSNDSLVADNIHCRYGIGARVTLNTYARYVAIVSKGYTRVRAIRIFTADNEGIPEPFVPENVLMTDSGKSTFVFTENKTTNVFSEDTTLFYPVNSTRLAAYTDGNTTSHNDMRTFTKATYRVGVKYSLSRAYYIDKITIYGGLSASGHTDTYSVYASDRPDDLFDESNAVIKSAQVAGTSAEGEVKKAVKYIAFACEDYEDLPRFTEIEAWTGDATGIFVPENLMTANGAAAVADKQSIAHYDNSSSYFVNGNFNAVSDEVGTVDVINDGDIRTNHDAYAGWKDDETDVYTGLLIRLNDLYHVGHISIFAGTSSLTDTYSVYASADAADLFNPESLYGEGVQCKGFPKCVDVNADITYIAVLLTECTSNGRIAEIEVITAEQSSPEEPEEPGEEFVSENVLATKVTSSRAMKMFDSGNVQDSTVFDNNGALAGAIDGDTSTHHDVKEPGIEPNQYFGAEYTLDKAYLIGDAVIYTGFDNNLDTIKVYASDSLATLYSDANKVADNFICGTSPRTIHINKNVQYFAVIYLSYGRAKEYQLWTADPDATEAPVTALSVLTIGNSFAQNASIYASEIAYANGKSLTFGYLKADSCTIEQHYNAAVSDLAAFRFGITAPDGTKTIVKDGVGASIASPDAEHGATIDEALAYMDWDVIVLQQESSNARDYASFALLDDLIDYVKDACPDAKLMFHEVWRWGIWTDEDFANIKANAERAARENGLEIIPSGLAFEYARELKESLIYPNDVDNGKYQHANTFGQYLAGVCYVDALFNISCSESTFASHTYVNANSDVAQLTACANKAARYYKSYGDIDFDGEINADDLTSIVNHLIGREVDNFDTTLADVNNDGFINLIDLVAIKKMLVNLEEAE